VMRGTESSASHGASCPSGCANGRISIGLYDLLCAVGAAKGSANTLLLQRKCSGLSLPKAPHKAPTPTIR
jgi:hypothetical protein